MAGAHKTMLILSQEHASVRPFATGSAPQAQGAQLKEAYSSEHHISNCNGQSNDKHPHRRGRINVKVLVKFIDWIPTYLHISRPDLHSLSEDESIGLFPCGIAMMPLFYHNFASHFQALQIRRGICYNARRQPPGDAKSACEQMQWSRNSSGGHMKQIQARARAFELKAEVFCSSRTVPAL